MKQHTSYNQRGDAMTVVVVILVVVLIGALGFIAWQNFGKGDANTADQAQQETTNEQTQNSVVALPKWNVEVPVGDANGVYEAFESVKAEDGTVDSYGIRYAGIDSVKGCESRGQSGPGPIGFVNVVDKEYVASTGVSYDPVVTIDGVEYGYQAEENPGACATDAADQKKIADAASALRSHVANLRKAE